jgi:hypothetical protein
MMTVMDTRQAERMGVHVWSASAYTPVLFPRTPPSSRSRAEDENYTPINALSYLPSPHAP